MTIWKIPGTHELELTEDILRRSSAKEVEPQTVTKNYFVLSGRLSIFERDNVRASKEIRSGKGFSIADDDEAVFGTEAKWDIRQELET